MEFLTDEDLFQLIAAGVNVLFFMTRYNAIIESLRLVDQRIKLLDPAFDMRRMWCCSYQGGELQFDVTMHCRDEALKRELKEIFSNTADVMV